MYCRGKPHLKRTETVHAGEASATIFAVDVERLLRAKALDFYSANNLFEARLVHGEGHVLERLRTKVLGKPVEMKATRRLIAQALAFRLANAVGDAILDFGEGIRDMRVSLAKAGLHRKLFEEGVEPWSIIPHTYAPEGELGMLLEGLCHSESYDELSDEIAQLDLGAHLKRTFGKDAGTMRRIARKASAGLQSGGKHVGNYIILCLLVEEAAKRSVWRNLPGRWALEREFSDADHGSSHITCDQERVEWMVSVGRGAKGRLERYGTIKY